MEGRQRVYYFLSFGATHQGHHIREVMINFDIIVYIANKTK